MDHTTQFSWKMQKALTALLIAFFVFPLPILPAPAQATDHNTQSAAETSSAPQEVSRLTQSPAGTTVTWQAPNERYAGSTLQNVAAALNQMPKMRYSGYELPIELHAFQVPDNISSTVEIRTIDELDWPYDISRAATAIPPLVGIEEDLFPPADEVLQLPPAPAFLMREGRIRGQRIAIVGVSPIYKNQRNEVKVALTVDAFIPNATPIDDVTTMAETLPELELDSPESSDLSGQQSSSLRSTEKKASVPSSANFNPVGIKIVVDAAGIQEVLGASLIEAGLPEGTDLPALHLRNQGYEVALDIRDADGKLDSETRVLFYAAPNQKSADVGDRWNKQAIYGLTIESTPGFRMNTRSVLPSTATVRTTALEAGVWSDYKFYESNMPGVDNDYWYSEKMTVDPSLAGTPAGYDIRTMAVENKLPAASTTDLSGTYRFMGSTRSIANHLLEVYIGGQKQIINWQNEEFYEDWDSTLSASTYSKQVDIVLKPSNAPSDIRFDKLIWRVPVLLTFGGQGARFSGVDGVWRYRLTNTPITRSLYDVTTPSLPMRLEIPSGSNFDFQDGPEVRSYVLADESNLLRPAVLPSRPNAIAQISGAHAIYIAPANFHSGLAPLVAHRQAEGFQVALIDVQDIYDYWGYGYVSPQAIRRFLQFANAAWQPTPISVALVGDSTIDPHDYLGFGNPNIIPAYLAHVDKWIGETACETCFAQLDGEDPLDTFEDPGFLMDIWIGRLSVQNEEQLAAVVNKILRYETATDVGMNDTWRQSSLYIADNFIQPNGAEDLAGDFAYLSDIVFQGDPYYNLPPSQSPNMHVDRVYYDPSPGGVRDPWREPDAAQARLRTIEALKKGHGLVSYNGHSNHFQWASTDRTLPQPFLFGLNDILELDNGDRLPIILEMTCLTTQFTQVSATGTTIDERFQRHENAGGIAVWGSTGLTVAFGHDNLMRGFQNQLWRSPKFQARLGALTEAGHLQLFSQNLCCQESSKVFALLGDPLTPARVWAADQTYIPSLP